MDRQSKQFDLLIQRLTGDCALASSFVLYRAVQQGVRDLLCQRDFYDDCAARHPHHREPGRHAVLVESPRSASGTCRGCPRTADIQGSIMVTRDACPVLVDPQGQGVSWIRAARNRTSSGPWVGREDVPQPPGGLLDVRQAHAHRNIEEGSTRCWTRCWKRGRPQSKNLIIQLDKGFDFRNPSPCSARRACPTRTSRRRCRRR